MNKIVVFAIIILIIAGVILAYYLGSQKPETTLIPEAGVSSQVTAEVNKYLNTKITSSDNKVTVYIPADAIRDEGYIALTPMEPNTFTDPETGWNRPTVINLVFATDMPFDNQIGRRLIRDTIESVERMGLTDDEKRDYITNRENYYIQFYDDQNEWKKLNYSIKSDNNQLCGEVNHLSLFSLAIKGFTKIPEPLPTIKLYQIPPK